MAQGLNGELIFEFKTIGSNVKSKARITWSETYDISQNTSTFFIDKIEMASPIWNDSRSRITGDITVNGITILQFKFNEFGRVTIPREMAYGTVMKSGYSDEIVTASITIPHDIDGTKTIYVEFVPSNADGYSNFTVLNLAYDSIFYMETGTSANNPQYVVLTNIPRSIEPEDPIALDDSRYEIQEGLEIVVLDGSFIPQKIIDNYESLIWTVRYRDVGDFELIMGMDIELYAYLMEYMAYFKLEESDRLMIPEKIEIQTDIENGDKLIIQGRSLESVLERRIVWGQKTFSTPVSIQTIMKTLMDENAINPVNAERKLWNRMEYIQSSDPIISGEDDRFLLTAQFYGESLLDIVKAICEGYNLGFKLIQNGNKNSIEFSLYSGLDRSPDQTVRPNVIFSPEYDNLITSNYKYDGSVFRNVALVSGQSPNGTSNSVDDTTLILGENGDGIRPEVSIGEGSLLNRYEMFVDAGNLSRTIQDGESSRDLTDEEYEELMIQEGQNQLAENGIIEQVDASVDPNRTFIFDQDYFLGDIVKVENQYGIGALTRVIEVIYSEDASGRTVYPTFEIIL